MLLPTPRQGFGLTTKTVEKRPSTPTVRWGAVAGVVRAGNPPDALRVTCLYLTGNESNGVSMSAQQNSDPLAETAPGARTSGTSDPVGSGGAPDAECAAVEASDAATLLQKAEALAAEMRDAWLRARAETENVRKQTAADIARAHKFAIERFAGELLAVKDALESSLAVNASPEALRAGVDLTLKQLDAAFEKAQIVEIDAAGRKFDPHRHQAMAMLDSTEPANTVVQVFQKGYLLADRVLRPAMVAVAKSGESEA